MKRIIVLALIAAFLVVVTASNPLWAGDKKVNVCHKGKMIKTIGRSSRFELEKIFKTHIFLDLTVRVEKNWSKNTRGLRKLGY